MLLIRKLLDLLLPRYCIMCGRRLTVKEDFICMHCNIALPRTYHWKDPEENNFAKLFWGRTKAERAIAYIYYTPHNDTARIAYHFKYFENPEAARALGRMMATELLTYSQQHPATPCFFDGIDAVIPTPIAAIRRMERGYNQCEEIAKGIETVTGIPVVSNALKRKSFKVSQTRLTKSERMENVEKAFSLTPKSEKLRDCHVLLIDDIVTTGATMVECAKQLQKIPGIRISIIAFGSTKRL